MSLTPIPYQPLTVLSPAHCSLPAYDGWKQLIDGQDVSQIQFGVGACATFNNMLQNPTFVHGSDDWNILGFWNFFQNAACSIIGTPDYMQQVIPDINGLIYTLAVDVSLTTGTVIVATNLGQLGVITQGGESVFTFPSNGVTFVSFLVPTNSAACIRNIRLKVINTRFRTDLEADGEFVQTLGDIDYSLTRTWLTMNIPWSELNVPFGCYRLAIYDPCECNQFGFIGDDFIVGNLTQIQVLSGTGAVAGTGFLSAFNFSGAPSLTIFRKLNVICRNVEYTFTYTLTTMAGTTTFQLRAGIGNGIIRTANGTYTETITSAHTSIAPEDLRWVFTFPTNATESGAVSNFSMAAVNPIPTFYTVPFQIVNGVGCTTLFSACGDRDEFNFGFPDTGFAPQIRLEGTLRGNGYPSKRSTYELSSGRKLLTRFITRKRFEFMFHAPEYVHDFMNLLLGLDNVYIDGNKMFSEDEEYPSLSTEADVDMAAVTLQFTAETELTENVRTSSVSQGGCGNDTVDLLTSRSQRPIYPSAIGEPLTKN